MSAGRDDYPSSRSWAAISPGQDLPDEEADLLWPPDSEEEAEYRAQAAAEVRGSRVEDLPDEELHELLFGTTAGENAG